MYIQYVFDSGYIYSGQIQIEKNGEFDISEYLDPLESATFYIFADIPDELFDKDEIVNIKISFNDFDDNRFSLNGTEKNRFYIKTKI